MTQTILSEFAVEHRAVAVTNQVPAAAHTTKLLSHALHGSWDLGVRYAWYIMSVHNTAFINFSITILSANCFLWYYRLLDCRIFTQSSLTLLHTSVSLGTHRKQGLWCNFEARYCITHTQLEDRSLNAHALAVLVGVSVAHWLCQPM